MAAVVVVVAAALTFASLPRFAVVLSSANRFALCWQLNKQTNKKLKKEPNERAKTSQLKVNKTRQCEGGGQGDGGGVARAEGNDYTSMEAMRAVPAPVCCIPQPPVVEHEIPTKNA